LFRFQFDLRVDGTAMEIYSSHWGQPVRHAKTKCVTHVWLAIGTKLTKVSLTSKGGLCCMLYSPALENKACNKAALSLVKAAL
jgi:hypothetical protein